MKVFMEVCEAIRFPVSIEKTFWSETKMIFLSLLVDGKSRMVCLPKEKIEKAINLIVEVLNCKKTTVHRMHQICGFLHFLGRGIVPGRAFTRRLYAISTMKLGKQLKPHHHVRLSGENRSDLVMWLYFLYHPTVFVRPFMDISTILQATTIKFFTDASKNPKLRCGGWCNRDWFFMQWDEQFILDKDPSIAYLELYGLTIGILLWISRFRNRRIILNCDNQATVQMINNSTASCRNYMVLIRLIVLECMIQNVRVFAKFVRSNNNSIADSLLRLQITCFKSLTEHMDMNEWQTDIPGLLYPMGKLWID